MRPLAKGLLVHSKKVSMLSCPSARTESRPIAGLWTYEPDFTACVPAVQRLLARPYGDAFNFQDADLHSFQRGIDSELELIRETLRQGADVAA